MTPNTGYLPFADYQQIQSLLDHHFDPAKVRILVFGSRATGTHQPDSDLDLVIMSETDTSAALQAFREALQYTELTTPVEVIAYEEATPQTNQRISEEGVLFWPQDYTMRLSK